MIKVNKIADKSSLKKAGLYFKLGLLYDCTL